MKNKIVTKQDMIDYLNNASDVDTIRYIGRALVAIFRYQTENERQVNQTNNTNDVGFSSSDARDGSITAKYFIKHGTLLGWMVDNWTRDWRGAPRITKYHRQLNMVATMKQQQQEASSKPSAKFEHDQHESFKHVFLGQDVHGNDVWFSTKFSEVIARFGNKPEEYRAMDLSQARTMEFYNSAVKLVDEFIEGKKGA